MNETKHEIDESTYRMLEEIHNGIGLNHTLDQALHEYMQNYDMLYEEYEKMTTTEHCQSMHKEIKNRGMACGCCIHEQACAYNGWEPGVDFVFGG